MTSPGEGSGAHRTGRNVHVVIVTYRRVDTVSETLRRVLDQSVEPDSVWIVDNDASDELRTHVQDQPAVTYLAAPTNLGPAGGFDLGTRRVLEHASDRDLICLIDDDDPPPHSETFADLIELFERSGHVAGVGLAGGRFDRTTALKRRLLDDELAGVVDVDTIGGNQCPIFLAEAIRQVGSYRPELFFGFEELDLGLRLRDAGWRLVVDGDRMLESRRSKGRLGIPRRASGTGLAPWRRYYSSRNIVLVARTHGRAVAPLLAFGHSGPAAALRALLVHRDPEQAWMAIRGATAGLLGRTGRVVEPPAINGLEQ